MTTPVRTVWKYQMRFAGEIRLEMPEGAEIVHVGLDPGGVLCAWAIVEPSRPKGTKILRIFGTGHEVPLWANRRSHVGTFLDGPYVWHVFDLSRCED